MSIAEVEPEVVDRVRQRLADRPGDLTPHRVAEALRAAGRPVGDATVLAVYEALRRDVLGAGPLEPLLRQPGVTDVLVNGPAQVYVDRGDGLEATGVRFADDESVRRLAQRLAGMAGRRLDDSAPFADLRLPDGSRCHAVLAPVSRPGTVDLAPGAARAGLHPRRAARRWHPDAGWGRAARRRWSRPGWPSWSAEAPAAARRRCSRRCSPWSTRPSGSSSSRTPPSCARTIRTSSRSRGGRPTSRARAPSTSAPWSDRPCGCVPTGWSSARCAAPRWSTCWPPSTPATTVVAAHSTPTPPSTCRPGSRRSPWPPGLDRAATHSQLASGVAAVVHLARGRDGVRRLAEIAVPRRGADGLVTMVPAVSLVDGALRDGAGAAELARVLGR